MIDLASLVDEYNASQEGDELPGYFRALLYGESGCGKTTSFLSFSKQYPEGGLPAEESLVIDDIGMALFDEDAIEAFRELGVRLKYVIDVPALIRQGKVRTVLDAMDLVADACQKWAKDGLIHSFCVDNLSSLNDDLVDFWLSEDNCPTTSSGKTNTMAAWGLVKADNNRFRKALFRAPCNLLLIAHSKVNEGEFTDVKDTATKKQKTLATANKTPGANQIVPDIPGKAGPLYTRTISNQIYMTATKKKIGGKVEFERTLWPYGTDLAQGKCRYQQTLKEKEEPHFGKIMQRIQENKKL